MSDDEFKHMLGVRDDHVEHAKTIAERGHQRILLEKKAKKLAAKKNLEFGKKTTTTSTTTESPQPEDESFDARVEWPECADVIDKIQVGNLARNSLCANAASILR